MKILAIALGITLLAFGVLWFTTHQLSPYTASVHGPSTQREIANWKIYRNDKYGFQFQYPAKWGDITIRDGNRDEQGRVACSDQPDLPFSISIPGSLPLYDAILTGPLEIRVLQFDHNHSQLLSLCREENSTLDLASDKLELDHLPIGNGVFLNTGRIKVFSELYIFDPNALLGGYDQGQDIDIRQFYKFYGPSVRIEAVAHYSAPFRILERYRCVMNEYKEVSEECARRWLQNSPDALNIRTRLKEFKEVIETFQFDQ